MQKNEQTGISPHLADTDSIEGEHLFARYPGFLVDMRYELTK